MSLPSTFDDLEQCVSVTVQAGVSSGSCDLVALLSPHLLRHQPLWQEAAGWVLAEFPRQL